MRSSKVICKSILFILSLVLLSCILSEKQFAQTPATIALPNCVQPPDQAVVDHASLSDADLALYGLPARSLFSDKAKWAGIVRSAKHRSCTLTATNAVHSSDVYWQGIWTGYFQKAGSSVWQYTDVSWNVPTIQSGSTWPSGSSAWVGIGGTNGPRLVQTGTDQTIDRYNNHIYEAWVENKGNTPGTPGYDNRYSDQSYEVFSVGANDSMYAYTHNNENYIADNSRGTYADVAFGPTPDSSTFECILERPHLPSAQYGTNFPPLTKINTTTFHYCEGEDYNYNWYYMGDSRFYFARYIMTNNGHNLATPQYPIPGSGTYNIYWNNSQ